ncbi:MAG: Na+/H+ antiporter NhaC family protein [Lentisphaerae bacterium]|nr:Na+/H+ antiporter NhaC family protein [Lentisphaerota bacterium]
MRKFFGISAVLLFFFCAFCPGTLCAENVSVLSSAVVQKNPFTGTFWALVPPLVAIVLALVTKEVYSSLFAGILLGGLFVSNFSLFEAADCLVSKGLIEAVKSTSGIFIFLAVLGILVVLINRTGSAAAFGKWAMTRVKSRCGVILVTFFLGILIFIDDYFNCLTVGNVMRPVSDAKKISRAKLAFVVDATAAPICMIAPVSSWAAAVSQYASGQGRSGFELFVCAIPFNFYSLLTLCFIILLTFFRIDYGPMAYYERIAAESEDISAVDSESRSSDDVSEKGRMSDMIIPVVLLIVFCLGALLYAGGILKNHNFIESFGKTDASFGLPLGALPVLILTMLYFVYRKVLTFKEVADCIPQGVNTMVPAILILTLATALKNMTTQLQAMEFIARTIDGSAASCVNFLPAVIFLVAVGLSFSTGTAWGTFGILIPIIIGIFPSDNPLFIIGISACLAGAVCGDHCSPISDTTIMSSAGSGCKHIIHVSTQLPYALTVAAFSFLGFVLCGFIQNWFVVFPILVFSMGCLLLLFKFFAMPRREEV